MGQLITGDEVRQAISQAATQVGGVPRVPIQLESVVVVNDSQAGLLRLAATEGASGTANVTVVAIDASGGRTTQTFAVTVTPDVFDGGPILVNPPSQLDAVAAQPLEIQLSAQDVEGNAYRYYARSLDDTPYTLEVNATTGRVVVTAPAGFVGDLELRVGV